MSLKTNVSKPSLSTSFWVLLIVLTLLLGFIGQIWASFLPPFPSFASYDLGVIICHAELVSLPYFIALLIYPIMRIKFMRNRIESIGLSAFTAYVYTVAISVGYISNPYFTYGSIGKWIAQRYLFPQYDWLYPDWMVPPKAVVAVTFTGGTIQWASWLPSIIFSCFCNWSARASSKSCCLSRCRSRSKTF